MQDRFSGRSDLAKSKELKKQTGQALHRQNDRQNGTGTAHKSQKELDMGRQAWQVRAPLLRADRERV